MRKSLVLSGLVFVLGFANRHACAATSEAFSVFAPAAAPVAVPAGAPNFSGRSRAVAVRPDALQALRPGASARLDLFPDVSLTASIQRIETPAPAVTAWFGDIPGPSPGGLVMVSRNGVIAARVQAPDGRVFTMVGPSGNVTVEEVDTTALPLCAAGVAPENGDDAGVAVSNRPRQADAPAPEPGEDGETAIDVLILYTTAARISAGGVANIEAQAQLAVEVSNQIYANSGIPARLQLAHIAETSYREPSDENSNTYRIMLDDLTTGDDARMDEVFELRDRYHADVTCLLVRDASYCGMGWILGPVTDAQAFARNAFCVVNYACASNAMVLAHEIGHLQGCDHDRENRQGPGRFPYAFGWRFTGDSGTQWRTVMAYAPGNRLAYFSSPDLLYDGKPTGVPIGDPLQADNASTIRADIAAMAAYRPATGAPALIAGRMTIAAESIAPANLRVDPDEKVTLNFGLRNLSNGETHNVQATLLPTAEIEPLTITAAYGIVPIGGVVVQRPFRLITHGRCGETLTATLRLRDGDTDLGEVTFPVAIGGSGTLRPLATTSSGAVSLAIPDGQTTACPLELAFPLDERIEDVNVGVRIGHPNAADLTLTLIAPSGQEVVLARNRGTVGDYGADAPDCTGAKAWFRDLSSKSITDAEGPLVGWYSPEEPLSALQGGPAAGTWTLRMADAGGPDGGTLYCWDISLTRRVFTCAKARPYTPADAILALRIAGGLSRPDRLETATRLDFADPAGVGLEDLPGILAHIGR